MGLVADAVQEIRYVVAGVVGIRKAFKYPPGKGASRPFAVVYAREGTTTFQPGFIKWLGEVVIEIHFPAQDLARAVEKVAVFVDSVPYALIEQLNDGGYTHLHTFGDIGMSFNRWTYGGIETIGYAFVVRGVKVERLLE